MKYAALLLLVATCFSTWPGGARADDQATYDIAILNGRVMDPETMFDAVRNVGMKDGIAFDKPIDTSPLARPNPEREKAKAGGK